MGTVHLWVSASGEQLEEGGGREAVSGLGGCTGSLTRVWAPFLKPQVLFFFMQGPQALHSPSSHCTMGERESKEECDEGRQRKRSRRKDGEKGGGKRGRGGEERAALASAPLFGHQGQQTGEKKRRGEGEKRRAEEMKGKKERINSKEQYERRVA